MKLSDYGWVIKGEKLPQTYPLEKVYLEKMKKMSYYQSFNIYQHGRFLGRIYSRWNASFLRWEYDIRPSALIKSFPVALNLRNKELTVAYLKKLFQDHKRQ